jgi:hypothetical protein
MIIYNGVTFETGVQAGDNVAMFPSYSVTTNKSVFFAGDTLVFIVSTTNILDGTVLYWKLMPEVAGYFNVTSGIISIKGNTATVTISVLNDLLSLPSVIASSFYVTIQLNNIILASSGLCLLANSGMASTGGQIVISGSYQYHIFTTSGTFTILSAAGIAAEYLIVGGGGAGGKSNYPNSPRGAGGGGAGGYRVFSQTIPKGSYSVVVGAGGAPTTLNGLNGSNSTFNSYSSAGGGGGGGTDVQGYPYSGLAGGSGGGSGHDVTAGGLGNTPSVTPRQGYNGGSSANTNSPYNGSGGGGSSGAGGPGGGSTPYGGMGTAWLDGNYYAGGGNGSGGTGGTLGGGGAPGVSGVNGTGGGGGGAHLTTPGSGGSGVVIIRVPFA